MVSFRYKRVLCVYLFFFPDSDITFCIVVVGIYYLLPLENAGTSGWNNK